MFQKVVQASLLLHPVGDVILVGYFPHVDVVFAQQELFRLLQVLVSHGFDGSGDGGREEECLARGGQMIQDLPHLLFETHVQHEVGLVQDQNPQAVESDGASP